MGRIESDVILLPNNLLKRTLRSKRMTRKVIVFAGAILATSVLVPTAIITHGYIVRPGQGESLSDWLQVLLPVGPPLVALLSVLILWRSRKRQPIGKGIAWGLFVASTAYMLFQLLTLSRYYVQISQDGTAYWGMLQLPAIWIALPLDIIAIGIGALIGWIVKRKLPTRSVEATL